MIAPSGLRSNIFSCGRLVVDSEARAARSSATHRSSSTNGTSPVEAARGRAPAAELTRVIDEEAAALAAFSRP